MTDGYLPGAVRMADVLQLYAITGVRGEIDYSGKFTHPMRKIVHERVHRI